MTTSHLPTGRIGPVALERIVDRGSTVIPTGWIRSRTRGVTPRSGPLLRSSPPLGGYAPILVMLASKCPDELAGRIVEHARAGRRIYILAHGEWGADELAKELASMRQALVYVRRADGPPASALLCADVERAVWYADGRWGMEPDQSQAECLRLAFLRLFWHHALDEGWNEGKGSFTFRAPRERPFDIPSLPPSAEVRLLEPSHPDATISSLKYPRVVVEPSGLIPDHVRELLVIPPSGENHESLREACLRQVQIGWIDVGLPPSAWTDDGAFVLLGEAAWRLRVRLNQTQASALRAKIPTDFEWNFQREVKLSALPGCDVWLAGRSTHSVPAPQQHLPEHDVPCLGLREALAASPRSWTEPDPLSLSARHTWRNIPPSLPAGGQVDPLAEAWRNADRQWESAISRVERELDGARSRIEGIGNRLAKFLGGSLLGLGSERDRLSATLADLKVVVPSKAESGAVAELVGRLDKVSLEVTDLAGGVAKSEREGDEAGQREEWEMRRAESKEKLVAKKAELTAREAEAGAVEAALKELAEIAEGSRDNDWNSKNLRLSDERKRLAKSIESTTAELKSLDHQLAEPFVPPAPKPAPSQGGKGGKGGAAFVPKAPEPAGTALRFPSESLPRVGSLHLHGKTRYLAIETWEELVTGEAEAARLKATLVAKELRQ